MLLIMKYANENEGSKKLKLEKYQKSKRLVGVKLKKLSTWLSMFIIIFQYHIYPVGQSQESQKCTPLIYVFSHSTKYKYLFDYILIQVLCSSS